MSRLQRIALVFFAGAVIVTPLGADPRYIRADSAQALSPVGRVEPTGAMHVARAAHSATLLPNGKVLIVGGMVGNGSFLASAELYDPVAGVFTATGEMRTARVGHQAALLADGRVMVVGGGRGDDRALAEIFDVATGRWTAAGQVLGSVMCLLKDGTLLIGGGKSSSPGRRSTETYDPTTGSVTAAGSMNAQLYGPATLLSDGRVLVAGGESASEMFGGAELYDPSTRIWTSTGALHVARDKHGAALLPNGRVLLVGGADRRGWNGQMTSSEIYDPKSGLFVQGPSMSSARFKMHGSVVALPNGEVLIAGGSTEVEIYDPTRNSFSVARGLLDEARFFSSATTLADGSVLIAGGYTRGTIASTEKAWVYKQ